MANTTWNPSDKAAQITLSGVNLIATNNNSSTQAGVRAIDRQITGRFYFEYTCNVFQFGNDAVGLASPTANLTAILPLGTVSVQRSGVIFADTLNSGSSLAAITAGTVICVAVDCASRLVWFRTGAAGNWNGSASANPATNAGGVSFSGLGGGIPVYPWVSLGQLNDQVTANFGDTAFVGAVPAGFTSGFTSGASIPTNTLATQLAAEQWLTTNPNMRLTQAFVEEWASVQSTTSQVILSQILIEQWASVDLPVVPSQAVRVQVLA